MGIEPSSRTANTRVTDCIRAETARRKESALSGRRAADGFRIFLEELRRELQNRIEANFDKARAQQPQPVKKISEEQRLARQAEYAGLFY